jgi:hypothetical protein
MSNDSIDLSGWMNIRQILANVKARLRIDDRQDRYLLQYIIDCISELNMFHLDVSGPVSTIIDISDINTVDLPSDYIDYLKIGYIVNGKIVTLTHNPSIPIPISGECGEDTNPFPDLSLSIPLVPTYGAGGGYNVAEYRIDKKDRRIILQGSVPGSQLAIEYISTGVSLNEETTIPRKYLPAIRAYVVWTLIENDPKVPMNDKIRKGDLYAQEVSRASMSELPTLDECMDAIYMGRRQTPKG